MKTKRFITQLFVLSILVVLAAPALSAAPETFDIYIDAVRGDDVNPGTLEKPLRSLPAGDKVKEGARIGLARGSLWRGAWNLEGKKVIIGSYGTGPHPVLTGYQPLDKKAGVRQEAYPNVYLFTLGEEAGAQRHFYPGVYVGDDKYDIAGALFRVEHARPDTGTMAEGWAWLLEHRIRGLVKQNRQEALAHVNNNPGWFFYTFEDGRHLYYVNAGQDPAGDERRYEFKSQILVLTTGEDSEISGLKLLGTSNRNGVVARNQNGRRIWKDVIYQDGGLHNMLAGNGRAWIDCVSISTPNGPASIFHLNSPNRQTPGAVYVRTKVIGPGTFEGAPRQPIGTAYYSHDSYDPNIVMIDVESQGASSFYGYDRNVIKEGGSLIVSGARVNDKGGIGERKGMPPAVPYGSFGGSVGDGRPVYIEDALAYLAGSFLQVGSGEYVMRNSTIVLRPSTLVSSDRRGPLFVLGSRVKARFENCTFIIDTYNDPRGGEPSYQRYQAGTDWPLLQGPADMAGSLHFESCLFLLHTPDGKGTVSFPQPAGELKLTLKNSLFSPGFVNLPEEGTKVSEDIFAKTFSWRDGDFSFSESSPARAMDAGARSGRPRVFRARAEELVREIVGYLP